MIQLLLILMTNVGRVEDRKKKKQKNKTKQNKQTNENEKFVH